MKKQIIFLILLSLFFSVIAPGAVADISHQTMEEKSLSFQEEERYHNRLIQDDLTLEIVYPESGYLYLFSVQPIRLPLASAFGWKYSIVVGSHLMIDTASTSIHHAEFQATKVCTGWKSAHRWDYRSIDGIGMDLDLTTGLYDITVRGYDEAETELTSDSIRVLFIKVGGDEFGIRINTRYDSGEMFSSLLDIGLAEFGAMLSSGESRTVPVTLQKEDDTSVEVRFIRTKILESAEKVIETEVNVETTCDTTKEYEVSLEARFPFALLEGGDVPSSHPPYFSAEVGYHSSSSLEGAPNQVATRFYFGRENIKDPRVFRLSLIPEQIDAESSLTFFTKYLTVNSAGEEVFHRIFSVEFDPATALTITSIPSEAKIRYDFGESAGMPTQVSFRAEGGLFDDIIQRFTLDPLPSYMSFDLTVFGERQLLYESDSSYDIAYSLDSVQSGNIVTFAIEHVPQHIAATWGVDLGDLGDLAAHAFADLDMSDDIDQVSVSVFESATPLLTVSNIPKKIHVESAVDIPNGRGNISLTREMDDPRTLEACITFDDLVLTSTLEVDNEYTLLAWNINNEEGTGTLSLERDADTEASISACVQYKDWEITGQLHSHNEYTELTWQTDREERQGSLALSRSAGTPPVLSFSLAHNGLMLSDSLEFRNEYLEVYWDLPTSRSTHTELGLLMGGEELVYNTLSLWDQDEELLSIGIGIQTEDHFALSWEYDEGVISAFDWSGRILKLSNVDIAVNLQGELFTVAADFHAGEQGDLELSLNKETEVTFLDSESDHFKVLGSASFFANSKLNVSWELGESGEFTIFTFSEPIGDDFTLEFLWDPQQTGNYRFGFRLVGEDFIEITRTIKWYSEGGELVRIWILGDQPLPGDWTLEVLWNYEWYTVPWP